MGNSAIGSALQLPSGILDAFDQIDKKIETLQTTINDKVNVVNKAFNAMASGTGIKSFKDALDEVIAKINAVGTAAQNAATGVNSISVGNGGNGLSGIGQGASAAAADIVKLSQSVDALSQSLTSQMANWAGISQQILNFTQQINTLKNDVLNLKQQLANAGSTGGNSGGGGSSKPKYNVYAIKAAAAAFANDQTIFNDTELTALLNNVKMATKALNDVKAGLTKDEQEQVNALIAGLRERITLRQTEAKLIANQQITLTEAQEYEQKATSIGKLKNAIEIYKRVQANMVVTDEASRQAAQQVADTIERLTEQYKSLTMSTRQQADAQQKATDKQQRAADAQQRATDKQADKNFSSYQGAMLYAQQATTIEQLTKAIKYLTAARDKENASTAEGKKNIALLNAEIQRCKKTIDQQTKSAQNLQTAHRGLLDIGGQLMRQAALWFSMSQVKGYVKQIAQVRGEFEMAQRSLQALLRNKSQADDIFAKTVALAVQSPYKIRDLVQYTRQLAAYRIENDKLYDTTKRLADVAAGLGVDMQRLILAYGQVKAAAFLKGTEVRQFTEAGINIYSELQEYFKEVKGLEYTTREIVKMISARKVTFEDVEAIFQRMTDKGGMFYNMQLIQSETLQGKIMKFQDSMDIMLNSIGKSTQGTLKWFLDAGTVLMSCWRAFVPLISAATFAVITHALHLRPIAGILAQMRMGMAAYNAQIRQAQGATATLTAMWKGLNGVMKASVIGAILSVIVGLIGEIISRVSDHSKAVKEINADYVSQLATLQRLVDKYKELREAKAEAGEATGDDGNSAEAANIEDRRTQFEKLLDTMKEAGFEADLVPSLIKDEELDEVFAETEKKYRTFIYRMQRVKKSNADDRANAWPNDSYKGDLEDYSKAMTNFAEKFQTIDQWVDLLVSEHSGYNEKQMATFQQLKEEQEGTIEYYEKAVEVAQELKKVVGNHGAITYPGLNAVNSVTRALNKMRKAEAEARAELTKSGRYEAMSEIALDKTLSAKERRSQMRAIVDGFLEEWPSYAKELAYKVYSEEFKIQIAPDEGSAEDATNYIERYMNDWLRSHEFTVRIKAGNVGEDFVEDFYTSLEDAMKKGKAFEERAKNLTKAQANGITGFTREMLSKSGLMGDATWADYVAKVMGTAVDASKVTEIPINALMAYYKTTAEGLRDLATTHGLDWEKEKKKGGGNADPLQERLRLLDEMNKRYEKLREYMDDVTAKEATMAAFGGAIKATGLSQLLPKDFTPDKSGLLDAYENLKPTAGKELGELEKTIAEVKIEIDQERLEKDLDAAKDKIEAAFNSLKLYETLKEAGLGDSDIQSMFKDIVTDYEGVQDAITKATSGKEGEKWAELVREQEQKLAQEQKEQQVKDFTDLVKEYKNAMSTRLQIDTWYWGEMAKMRNNANFLRADPQLQKEMLANLESKYNEKQDDATWDEFTNSDYYTRIFDDLEGTSTRMLQSMSERIASLRDNLQNLSPAQVEKIIKAQKELDEITAKRNPFEALQGGLTKYIANLKKRKKLEEEIAKNNATLSTYDEQIRAQNDIVNDKKQAWNDEVALSGEESKEAEVAKTLYEEQYKILQDMIEARNALNQETDNQIKGLNDVIQLNENMKTGLASIGSWLGDASATISSAFEALGDWGINIDMPDDLEEVLGGFSKMDSAISEIVSGEIFQGTFDLIGGIGKTFGGIFGWGSKDEKLQEKIDNLSKQVSRLEREYERIEEALSLSLSTSDIVDDYEEGIANLQQQISDYKQMIKLEEDKKDTDSDAIQEYQEAIEDLQEEMEDLHNDYLEMLGGISTDDFRSVAEEFAEAWIDAFNETEDGMEALTDTLQDYLNDMLKAQVTNAAASRFIEPIETSLNELVEQWGDITQINKEDLDEWIESSEDYLQQYNDFLEYYFDKLGITPSSTDSSLSALQQGIQSITEETGAALESLLNSMRFYLATQQSDVAIIKTTLASMAGLNSTDNNSTLTELKAQTTLLQSIDNRLSGVIKAGHAQGGKGLKVFLS